MSLVEYSTLLVLVLVAIGWYLSYSAARLDRLHTRVEGTFAALDAQLVRRAEAALELANSGILDPASSLYLAGASSDSLSVAVGTLEEGLHTHGDRGAVESDLTQSLRLVLTPDVRAEVREDDVGVDLLQRVADAHQRAGLARRFHNDAVTDVTRYRQMWFISAFRLAGHTALPKTVELDDDLDLSD